MKPYRVLIYIVVLAIPLIASIAKSAVITVNSATDDGVGCTLRAAVESVNDQTNSGGCAAVGAYGSGDAISTIGIADILLTQGEVLVSESVQISGDINSPTTIRGNGSFSLMRFSNPATNSMLLGLRFESGRNALSAQAAGLTIERCEFDSNFGTSGAAVNSTGQGLTIKNSVFFNNKADSLGGALFSNRDDLTIEGSVFLSNEASSGGALHLFGDSVSIKNSSFSNNTSNVAGALYFSADTALIANSTFDNNSAIVSDGGAIYLLGSNVDIINSTISNNQAVSVGGGIYSLAKDLKLYNSTITGNHSGARAGGLYLGFNTTEIRNSIVVGNESISGQEIYFEVDPLLEYSVIGEDGKSLNQALQNQVSAVSFALDSTNILATSDAAHPRAINSILLPLTNNGGDTKTHALAADSPAGDTGDNMVCASASVNSLDQIDQVRPFGSSCDIGAFESQSAIFDGDSDGVPSGIDNCPFDANPDQQDSDQNGIGDECDADDFCLPIKAANGKIAVICL